MLFPFYMTFYTFVFSLFSPVSVVLPVNHKSLGHPRAMQVLYPPFGNDVKQMLTEECKKACTEQYFL